MGYQALLFCPDEKLARVVSQVFTELDFNVDPVHEPFAAVKKLMAQRFDAIVVDCENEQNASLLFKSARNSGSNQSSLAIAVVEGQAGVAKAYRIGANLVLTKPINVEQAKGTLRVARGLLRKNSDAATASAANAAAPVTPPQPRQTPSDFSSPSSPAPAPATAPARAPLSFAASAPSVPSVGHSHPESPRYEDQPIAIAPAVTQTQFPAQAPAMSTSAEIAKVADTGSDTILGGTFQDEAEIEDQAAVSLPESHAAFSSGPEVSANISHSFSGAKQPNVQGPSAQAQSPSIPFAAASASSSASAAGSPTGSAAATAPAKTALPEQDPVQHSIKEMASSAAPAPQQSVASSAPAFVFDTASTNAAPSFGILSDAAAGEQDSDGSGGNKKMLIAAAAVLAIAALGYLGYTKMFSDHGTPAPQPASSSQTFAQPSSAPVTSSSPSTNLSTIPSAVPSTTTSKAAISASPEKLSIGTGNSPTIHIGADATTASAPNVTSTTVAPAKKPASAPIQVKASDGTGAQSQSDDPAPSLATPPAVTANTNSLSSLMSSTSSTLPIPTLATVRVSQGVSQGLVIKRVQPKYPAAALAARTTGAVQIEATVSKDGTVTNAKVLSGDLVLAHAALEAVRQWRYKPYYLDGAPVEIQTQITVNFKAN